ncbi:MAG: SEC-C domain-containing protein [Spirochaetota bacterium]
MKESAYRDSVHALMAAKRALKKHDPARALPLMREAVAACPVALHYELARRLYWLSMVLFKLGRDGPAVKALASAQKLDRRGHGRAVYNRKVNGYGMPRASCTEHDDYKAFFSIQVGRYLSGVPGRRFTSQEELEEILRLIAAAWLSLGKDSVQSAGSCADKLDAFREVRMEFPALRERSTPFLAASRTLAANFRTGEPVFADSRCPCGSGLTYSRCCGRLRMPFELDFG